MFPSYNYFLSSSYSLHILIGIWIELLEDGVFKDDVFIFNDDSFQEILRNCQGSCVQQLV